VRAEVGLSHGDKTVQDAAIAYVLALKHGINNDISKVEAYSIIKAWTFDNSKDHLATWLTLLESLPEETFL
jgi:hypothetical protein